MTSSPELSTRIPRGRPHAPSTALGCPVNEVTIYVITTTTTTTAFVMTTTTTATTETHRF